MYYGSSYCATCKNNRTCYCSLPYNQTEKDPESCIIMRNIFYEEYKKVNAKKED